MVFLSIPNVKTMSINVNPSATTISAFEQLVHQRTHLPQPLLRYSLGLRKPSLDPDSALLSDLGFGPLSTVLVHVPLIGGVAPPHYVAGLGRGATGFTTRSDIGPARADGEVEADVNHKFDDFEGNDAGLFANAECDDGDKEADAFWEAIDRKMDSENYRASNPKVSEQFVDLKRKLHTLSEEEWDSIPEIGNYSHRSKKKRFESFVPVPDTLLQKEGLVTALDPNSRAAGGSETPWTDLTSIGEGRGLMLSLKLDRLSDSLSGQTVVDPKGYLTDLKNKELTNDADIFHINRARPLLKSITQSNPKNPNGWIAAARLEERAGKIKAARTQIQKGCNECPKHEDVWVEACRLATPEDAKAVIAMGVKQIPNSVKLWLEAAKLENNEDNKSRVLRKGLEHIPDSVRLWKTVVDMATKEDALVLLHRAVECCPLHPELWMALARLETYENTKIVLNRAREKLPKERGIWITDAKLEEDNGNTAKVGKIIEKGINALQREGVVIDREKWMEEAEKSIWLKAAQLEKSHGSRDSLDAVLRKAVTYLPQAEVLWLMCAKEKWLAGDIPAARGILQEAHAAIPNSEEIWLAAFKLEFESREVERARMILAKARERGTTGRVWMKSAIVERELGNVEEERRLLEEGVKKFPAFFKLWLMLGQLGERFRHLEQAKNAYKSGLKHCPECTPLWLSLADLEEKVNGLNKARAVLTLARKKNPKADKLWLAAVRAEIRHGNKREAERLMSKALQESPKSGILLAADIEMAGPCQLPQTKIDDALKKCVKKEEAHVTATVAKIFWKDRKVNKARLLFEQTVTLDPDNGDFWALYYKFELEHGSEEKQKEVLTKCVASEPKHGEKWQAISKALENAHQPVEVILKRVVIALRREERNKL
ncbi:PRP1 splicing factor N-terminal [Arabidopsis thaliana x Arabidopsis arenosa]|uniref:PRP1 splicing factor N-terminal n=1 Tax=Arabidopsis thaliana x Arabidopsis arenosa TaxID=1240361 RepID=A0A8T1Y3A8_9BRAS|nr:PRP1 splicing factor N-terminal [Arabidopsis thaliana x Arabidopsis arenosa]